MILQAPPSAHLYFMMFFTFWNILLVAFHKYTSAYVDLLYLSFVVLIVGLYLSFINPAKFTFRIGEEEVHIVGVEKFIISDILSHFLVFLYVVYLTYGTRKLIRARDMQLYVSVLIIVSYIVLVDVRYVYGISLLEMLIVFCSANLMYFILF
jgi:hypothetical protein